MKDIRVNVEGAPEDVAKFFKEMGQNYFGGDLSPTPNEVSVEEKNTLLEKEEVEVKEDKKERKPRQKKAEKEEVKNPDPEFEGVPSEELKEESKPSAVTLPMVKEALKEYGIWIVEQGHESSSAKNYLIALLKKYGGVGATKDLKEEDYEKVFNAAVAREPMEALGEWK